MEQQDPRGVRPMVAPLMTTAELAHLLCIDRSTISRMVSAGHPVAGLRPVYLTPYTYRWRRAEVAEVIGLEAAA